MAAKREIIEETGIDAIQIIGLKSMCYLPADCIAEIHRKNWNDKTYVLPEYAFAFEANKKIKLSDEHTELLWASYEKAVRVTGDIRTTP